MTLQPRIEELKKLYEKATPLPWTEVDPPISGGEENPDRQFIVSWCNAFPAIVEALEQRWILVSERLPEQDMGCIAAMERSGRKFVDVADYFVDGGWQRAGCTVTHWQPLPAPPATKASE